MIKAMYTAAAGMTAQQTNVDVIAHNLANVNTAGFKRSATNFEDLLYVTMQQPGARTAGAGALAGIQIGSGARLVSTTKTFTPGVLSQTGNPLDFAISGEGFFELQGANGERYFTRDGHFLQDGNGDLVNATGLKLVPNINIPADATNIAVARDGMVSYRQGETIQEAGQINVVRFVNPAGLSSEGENYYVPTDNSGDALTVVPGVDNAGTIIQGFEERSNVDVATELISMIVAQRAFEVNSKAIQTADSMLNTTNNLTR